MNVLPDVYMCFLRKTSAPLVPEETVNVHTWHYDKFTEDANWNKRKWRYNENKDLSEK